MTLIDDFLQDRIDPATFDHRAHVVVGHDLLKVHPIAEAIDIYTKHLRALTKRAGAPEKFSARITQHALKVIAARMQDGETSEAFLLRNPDLLQARTLLPR